MEANANDMKIKLEEDVELQHDVEFPMESCSNQNIVCIKTEVKEEHLWEDESEEIEHQPAFESVFFLQITDEENVSENKDNHLPSSETSRLNTEAGHDVDSCTCTSPQGEDTLNYKPFSVCRTHGKNDYKESSSRENNCSLESDHHNKNAESTSKCRISEEGRRLHRCQYCERKFKKKSHLNTHIFTHSGAKPFKCESCEKSFNNKSTLMRHTVIHSGKKPYKCEICNKGFNSKPNLQGHMLCHSGIKPYKCEICKKSFSSNRNMKAHIVCHLGIKPYECDICKKSFNNKSNLIRHALCHSDTKPFKCDSCGKTFKRKSCLNRHTLNHPNSKS